MESAREIFNKCCIEIAEPLTQIGYRYQPSKHSVIKVSGDLKFEIHFQSSFRNFLVPDGSESGLRRAMSKLMPFGDFVTFGSVALIEHASVHSKMMKNFRKSVPNCWAVDDTVTGEQIGNLQSRPRWVQFNLANPHTRNRVVTEARQLIHDLALPYFKLFENPSDIIARLLDGSMPWTWEPNALEYVCCFSNINQAKRLLNKFINDSPGRAIEYNNMLLRYRSEGVPEAWDSTAPARLAKAAIILGLDSR